MLIEIYSSVLSVILYLIFYIFFTGVSLFLDKIKMKRGLAAGYIEDKRAINGRAGLNLIVYLIIAFTIWCFLRNMDYVEGKSMPVIWFLINLPLALMIFLMQKKYNKRILKVKGWHY
jgi:hypothetical protein